MSEFWVHNLVIFVHITAAMFWLGWIVFIFMFMVPSIRSVMPDTLGQIQPIIQKKVRRVVFWLIIVITATGLHNMHYRNLFDPEVLFGTQYGTRFLIKLGAALIMFAVYFSAPAIMRKTANLGNVDTCCNQGSAIGRRIGVILHVIAFTCGMVAAFTGVSLGN